jgi:hypothetical protein
LLTQERLRPNQSNESARVCAFLGVGRRRRKKNPHCRIRTASQVSDRKKKGDEEKDPRPRIDVKKTRKILM